MRLICPNCDAQYEVAEDAIPPGGRDVQCSNCGHGWYQVRPEEIEDEQRQDALFDPPEPEDMGQEAERAGAWTDATDADDEDAAAFDAPEPMKRRAIDEAVLDVLREEAEREVAARRAEAPAPLESQPDLGLEAAAAPALSPAARRIAQMKGVEPEPPPPPRPAGPPAKGRDLLPDIEEINSTLDPDDDRRGVSADDLPQPQRVRGQGGGFRTGFSLVVTLAVLAVVLYVIAPRLSQQIPGLAGTLEGYVAFVDGLRLWLSGLLDSAATTVQGNG